MFFHQSEKALARIDWQGSGNIFASHFSA